MYKHTLAKFARLGALCALVAAPLAGTLNLPGAASATTLSPKPHRYIPPPEAVGIYPSVVAFSNVLRGGHYVETVGVLNGTSHGQWFHFSISGQVARWLTVTAAHASAPLKEIWAHNGAIATQAVLHLQVPATLADGTYRGTVTVWMKPASTKKNGPTTVGLGGQVEVVVSVSGTEVVSGRLVNAYAYPKLEQGEPLKVFALVDNSGNVSALPSFHLLVLKKGYPRPVYNWVGTTGEPLLPGQRSTYELDWPARLTEGATLGLYSAKIASVTFPQGKDVGAWALTFQLYPFGSLHRGGKLLDLKLANKPRVGYSAQVEASVASSGEVQQETYFVGQLYRNGTFVQGIKSPVPVLLAPEGQPGDAGVIQLPVAVPKAGTYRLTGVANFAGAESNPLTLSFTVGSQGLPVAYLAGAAGAAGVLLVLLGAIVFRSRRRRGPPSYRGRAHVPAPHPAARASALRVPGRAPVGAAPTRSTRARRG
jgi:hypothetical protein